ncbi:CNT_collapsed_G0024300.mRNA.1.CDS.1 [Saccharomyces cerevisiae]|nr:CNT_collapsed_G0024300.mRNA.1.CDS.1 [Saccharomyces cerevisiae]
MRLAVVNEGNNTRLLTLFKSMLSSEANALSSTWEQYNNDLRVVDTTLLFSDVLIALESFIFSTQTTSMRISLYCC